VDVKKIALYALVFSVVDFAIFRSLTTGPISVGIPLEQPNTWAPGVGLAALIRRAANAGASGTSSPGTAPRQPGQATLLAPMLLNQQAAPIANRTRLAFSPAGIDRALRFT